MGSQAVASLLVITGAAVAAPMLADLLARRVVVPVVVLEIGLGIAVGPDALGWASDGRIISFLANLGLATLLFLAGYEIEYGAVRGQPARLALLGWLASLVLAIGGAGVVAVVHADRSWLIVGLALTTTALGTILPMLRDTGDTRTRFGAFVLATGAVGEFGPVVAVSLLLTSDAPLHTAVLLGVFAAIAAVGLYAAARPRSPRLARLVVTTLDTSAQLGVRIAVVLLALMVAVAEELRLDVLLGAFAAGLVYRQFVRTGSEREAQAVESKLAALGFGFLVPVFFVVSGMRFDVGALLGSPGLLALVPATLALLLVVRGVPTWVLHRSALAGSDRSALALLSATGLPLVVVVTQIGVQTGRLSSASAAVLVGGGLLSVLLLPALALRLRRRTRERSPAA